MHNVELNLSTKQYEVLENLMDQALGYPIHSRDLKLGFPSSEIKELRSKITTIAESQPDKTSGIRVLLSEEDISKVLRIISTVFTEIEGYFKELSTVTGYQPSEVGDLFFQVGKFSQGSNQ